MLRNIQICQGHESCVNSEGKLHKFQIVYEHALVGDNIVSRNCKSISNAIF